MDHPSRYVPETFTTAIRAAAAEAERIGHLHPQQLSLVYEQGWFNMLVPKVYGGGELPLPEVLQLEEALAWADGSLGWVVTLCSGAGWFAGFLNPALATTLYQDLQACLAGSGGATGTAIRTHNGYTITGYWKHASGAVHATAFTVNCLVEENGQPLYAPDGAPLIRTFLLKKEEVTIHNTWNPMGMIATGSHAFEAEKVSVPANRCFTIAPEQAHVDAPLYRYPFLQLAETTLAVNLSGMAIRFLDLCDAYAKRKAQRSAGSLPVLTANAQAQLNNHRQTFYEATMASWEALLHKGQIPTTLLDNVSMASRELVQQCRQCITTLFPYCGLEAADKHSELNRVWRNFHTAGQHSLFSPEPL